MPDPDNYILTKLIENIFGMIFLRPRDSLGILSVVRLLLMCRERWADAVVGAHDLGRVGHHDARPERGEVGLRKVQGGDVDVALPVKRVAVSA